MMMPQRVSSNRVAADSGRRRVEPSLRLVSLSSRSARCRRRARTIPTFRINRRPRSARRATRRSCARPCSCRAATRRRRDRTARTSDDRTRSQEADHRQRRSAGEARARDRRRRHAHRGVLRRSGLRDPSRRSRRRSLHAVPVRTTLPDAATQPWPMGDAPSTRRVAGKLDRAKMQAAVDLAFADPAGLTAAMVVVHKGQIVGERYMPGITKDTQLESWSMGKSLTATLVGLVIKDGAFSLDDPAPVPDWRRRRRSARRHPRARRDAHVERPELHRPGRSLDGSDVAIPRSLLHLRGRGRRVQIRDHSAGRVRAEHRRPLSQFRSDDARVSRAPGSREDAARTT